MGQKCGLPAGLVSTKFRRDNRQLREIAVRTKAENGIISIATENGKTDTEAAITAAFLVYPALSVLGASLAGCRRLNRDRPGVMNPAPGSWCWTIR